ncbi:MAG: UDP-N-acetylmuramate dehydrogenase [Saccharospirillum sp.]
MNLNIRQQVSLSALNTLAVPSVAAHFAEVTDREQLPAMVTWARQHGSALRILGGGSNLVLPARVEGLVLAMRMRGRHKTHHHQSEEVWRFLAGESWHEVVCFTVQAGLCGLENLALIPGLVGAAPVQNIGAYGVELSDHLVGVEAYDCEADNWVYLNAAECNLSYRDSRFKKEEGHFIITAVDLRLYREFTPRLDYGPLQALRECDGLTPKQVMDQVIATRQAKLPDTAELPNAGSFFKNPVVDGPTYQRLRETWPGLVAFAQPAGQWKLAAGWLIEQAGLKGQSGDSGVGCYQQQALVLVNPQRAGIEAIMAWQHRVQNTVAQLFGVPLEPEPRFWD